MNGRSRQALADGLRLEKELGYDPVKMGVVAGADAHFGYQGNEEFNFHGGHGMVDDTPKKRLNPKMTLAGGPATEGARVSARAFHIAAPGG